MAFEIYVELLLQYTAVVFIFRRIHVNSSHQSQVFEMLLSPEE